jgi:hypothetical protein
MKNQFMNQAKLKILLISITIISCIALVVSFSGCAAKGALTQTEALSYYYPTWTADGKIVALRVKETYRTRNQITLVQDADADIIVMDDDGTNESAIVADIFAYGLQASPVNNYLAGEIILQENIGEDDERLRSRLVVWNLATGEQVTSFNTTSRAAWFDWGPAANKIAVMQSTANELMAYELAVYEPFNNGVGVTLNVLSDVKVVSWKHQDKIAYIKDDSSDKLAFVKPDGSDKVETDIVVGFPFSYVKDSNYLYSTKDGIKRVDISTNPIAEDQLYTYSLDSYEAAAISFDGQKAILTKKDGNWGMFVLDVASNVVTEIK